MSEWVKCSKSDCNNEFFKTLKGFGQKFCSYGCYNSSRITRPRKTEIVKCGNCNREFSKDCKEVNRSKKRNRLVFCTPQCAVSHNNLLRRKDELFGNIKPSSKRSRRDELSCFRYFRVDRRAKRQLETPYIYLKQLWEKQGGKCALTGIDIKLPTNSDGFDKSVPPYRRASVDRIDSSLGYVEGNIQFVSQFANFAKNKYSNEIFKEFLRAIIQASNP